MFPCLQYLAHLKIVLNILAYVLTSLLEPGLSDNGRHYDYVNYQNFADSWGIEHVSSSQNYP